MTTTKTAIQVRRDTATNWSTNNPIPKQGEFCYETDTHKVKIGDGSTRYNSLGYIALAADKQDNLTFGEGLTESSNTVKALSGVQMADHLYAGENLATKFATEIANYSDIYAWLKARCTANNFEGIHVGDYFTYQQTARSISDGTTTYSLPAKTMTARIAGIDTYFNYGDGGHEVKHHIDFITTTHIGVNIPFNPANNNNGTADEHHPWLASKIYACLNGVDNYSVNAYNDVPHGFNAATSGGVLQSMPQGLQDVIVTKRMYLPQRYSASGLLTAANTADWTDMGKLWLPTEQEVYGQSINSGGVKEANNGLDRELMGSPVQYPLFAGTAGNRNNKLLGRVHWWLASVATGSSTRACGVSYVGSASAADCTDTGFSAPVCFRISAQS